MPSGEQEEVATKETKIEKEASARVATPSREENAELVTHLFDINKQIEDLGFEISVLKEQSASLPSGEAESIIRANEKALEKLKQERAEFEEKALSKEERAELAGIRVVAAETEISKEKSNPMFREVIKMYSQKVIQKDIERIKNGLGRYKAGLEKNNDKTNAYFGNREEQLLKDLESLDKKGVDAAPKESPESLLKMAEDIYKGTKKEAEINLKNRRKGTIFKKDSRPDITAYVYTFLAKMEMGLGHNPDKSLKRAEESDKAKARGIAEHYQFTGKEGPVTAEKIVDLLKIFQEEFTKKTMSERRMVEFHEAVSELDFSSLKRQIMDLKARDTSEYDISLLSSFLDVLVAVAQVPPVEEVEAQKEVEDFLKKAA